MRIEDQYKSLYLLAVTGLLAGCSAAPVEEPASAPPKPAKKAPPPAPSSGLKRGTLINEANQAIKTHKEAKAKATYNASPRVRKANTLRPWTEVQIPNTGITCWMKTRWADDQVLIRLALLGPRESLNSFMPGIKQFKLTIKDMQNATVLFYTISPNDFEWAPPSVNNGTPTLQFESSAPCSLDEYERCNLWSFDWDW